MSKHTPGPWFVKASHKNAQERFINAGKDPLLGYEKWDGLAVVYGSDDDPGNGLVVMEANAKLIAAAPDLLEALKLSAETLAVFVDDGSAAPDSVIGKILTTAQAAIKKATT